MTQLGEPVKVDTVAGSDPDCPFNHAFDPPPKVSNDLVGTGTKLKSRMEQAQSTDLVGKPKIDAQPSPRDTPGFPFYQGARSIVLRVVSRQGGQPSVVSPTYTLTLAAHHCIPAQESLKESSLLAWMNNKSPGDDVKDGKGRKKTPGVIWSSIGYDVNGSENGVWLPGNYAVCGSRNGSLWQEEDDDFDEDDEDEEIPPPEGGVAGIVLDAKQDSRVELMPVDDGDTTNGLYGTSFDIGAHNRKWHYVWQAMEQSKAQFHDRHESYSRFVLKILEKIAVQYTALGESNFDGGKCPDCKKVREKIKEAGYPPPYKLKARLDGVAKRLGQALTGPRWPPGIHTSKWVKAYISHIQRLRTEAQNAGS